MSSRIVRDVGTVAIGAAGVALVVSGAPAGVGWALIVTAAALIADRCSRGMPAVVQRASRDVHSAPQGRRGSPA